MYLCSMLSIEIHFLFHLLTGTVDRCGDGQQRDGITGLCSTGGGLQLSQQSKHMLTCVINAYFIFIEKKIDR